ncbi:MAG: S8 family serine peptidase [Planctomycetota bacterium]
MTYATCVSAVMAGAMAVSLLAQDGIESSPRKRPTSSRIIMLTGTRPSLDSVIAARLSPIDSTNATRQAVADLEAETVARRASLCKAIEDSGGKVIRHFWIIDAVEVEIGPAAESDLLARPEVQRVVENSQREMGDAGRTLPILLSTDFQNHNSDGVNVRGIRGSGVAIAIVDSGLDVDMNGIGRPHRTFYPGGNPSNPGGGIGGSRILANRQIGAQPAGDIIDHGTRVAGVAAGARWNNSVSADDGHAPEARFVGYSLPDLQNGATELSSMVQAWQTCAIDAAALGIRVAVISYDGTSDPLSPEQAAMDACAEVADIAICAMAGNDPSAQSFYQGATNIVSVGSVQHDTHAMSAFSARGPLISPGLGGRRYPTCVANGDLITMPSADQEGASVLRSGTSYSAPQVAGALALFRSVSTATADEARAALVATLDSAAENNAPNERGLGFGYLRDDRLVDLAQGRLPGQIRRGAVDSLARTWSASQQVNRGETWSAAVAWSRRNTTSTSWANLRLRVVLNGQEIASSDGEFDTIEAAIFAIDQTGTLTLEVTAVQFETGRLSQGFGFALARSVRPTIAKFGEPCEGPRPVLSRAIGIEPVSAASGFSNGSSNVLFGGQPHRVLQWIDTPGLASAFSAKGIGFRRDESTSSWQRTVVDLALTLSQTEARNATASPSFAQNYGRLVSTVIARRSFALPAFAAPPTDAGNFDVVLPFDRPFARVFDPFQGGVAHSLMLDLQVFGGATSGGPVNYPLDAELGSNAVTVFANNPMATSGTVGRGIATVFGFHTAFGNGARGLLEPFGTPALGTTFGVDLSGASPLSPVILFLGFSNQFVAGTRLPLSLAAFGGEGCFLQVSPDLSLSSTATATAEASFRYAMPVSGAALGIRLYHQAMIADPNVNALGFRTSDGLQAVIGR